jgi:hypothetical protein
MTMIEKAPCDSLESRPPAVESLNKLLDYAMAEGSELRLPAFVLLLRMARLELARSHRPERHLNSASSARHNADAWVAS